MIKIKVLAIMALFVLPFLPKTILAKDGYKINVQFTDVKEETKVYLCHYFGKGGTVFKDDSTTLKNGAGSYNSTKKLDGGIYLFLFEDKATSMEIILQNGDDFSMTTAKSDIVPTAKFKGKSENDLFYTYQRFLVAYGKGYQELTTELATAKTKKDSTDINKRMITKGKELTGYRKNVIKNSPNTFLAKLFLALEEPVVPEDWPVLEDGTKDSTFPSRYYQAHYWDDFDFQDDRLIYTPIYEPKLQNFFDKWVVPTPDSVIKEANAILKKADGTEQMFKYSLWYITRWAETSKIMGMDEVFVYLVEEYYMKNKATWLEAEQLEKYIKRAEAIAPNMIGQPAMDIRVRNMANEVTPLSSVNAAYTLLIFYDADCGHCKTELPKIDSLYKRELYKYGLQIFAVETTNEVEKWKKLIEEKKLNFGWIHTYDPTRETNYKAFYDVYVNPTIYLLDDKKTIIGKKVNHSNILDVIKYYEKKKADKKK